MTRPVAVIAALLGIGVALGAVFAVIRGGHDVARTQAPPAKNLTVTLGDQSFTLVDGVAVKATAAGAKETVRVVGDGVSGDVNGDGKPETALLIADDPGGSGTFYYAVLAVSEGDSWRATNALPLGDRIKPENIEYADNQFVYHFLERKPDEPMAATPTTENIVPVRLDPATGRISAWG